MEWRKKKYEGRTTVRRRRVIIQLDPAATFLFLVDKDILTHTIIFPTHFLYLRFFCLYISFSFLPPPSLSLSLLMSCNNEESVGSSASLGRQRERQIHNGRLCMFVCLSGAHPCSLFKPLLERRGASGVNGELKQMCLCARSGFCAQGMVEQRLTGEAV